MRRNFRHNLSTGFRQRNRPRSGFKQRLHNNLKVVGRFIETYFQYSSIHGCAYIAKKELTLIEKSFWLFLVLASIIIWIVLSFQSVQRFRTKSTVMGLECDYVYWNRTLPALTVCPTDRLSKTRFNNFCSVHSIVGKRKEELFEFLETLANTSFTNTHLIPEYESIDSILTELHIEPRNYMELIFNLTQNLAMLSTGGLSVTPPEIYPRQILTEFGICYTANTYLSEKYSSKYFLYSEYPEPPLNADKNNYISTLDGNYFDVELFYSLQGFLTNMLIFAHSPFETMRVDANPVYSEENYEFFFTSKDITTEDALESDTTPEQRRCRFPSETNIQHFPIYTRNLCRQQCRIDLSMQICNCIPHFYPNRLAVPKPVCSYRQLKTCIGTNFEYLLKFYDSKTKIWTPCTCVPNCRDASLILNKDGPNANDLPLNTGKFVMVTSKDWPPKRYKRQIIFTFTDLMVSVGGTAGLFLGFSVLGLLEFCYFFTIRLLFYLLGRNIQAH